MTIIDCEQGSREWVEARLGIPTASEFKRIVTAGGKLSSQARRYKAVLLAEWALGEPFDEFETEWQERGKLLEPQARSYYGVVRDCDVRTVGFCQRTLETGRCMCSQPLVTDETDDACLHCGLPWEGEQHNVGASPDGLVGDVGLLELKCPAAHTHLIYLAEGGVPREYKLQIQGQLWVTGREWCDFLSYHPDLPPHLVRAEPDEKIQAALDEALPAFVAELAAGREALLKAGVQPQDPREHERLMAEYEREQSRVEVS